MIRALRARRFRNLEDLSLELDVGITLVVGGTGAGKTSVLEALYAAATTRSFRTSQWSDCVQMTPSGAVEEGFWVAADVECGRRSRLELSWSRELGMDRRLDGERVSILEHLRVVPIVCWTSAEIEMLLGSPSLRRRFLDRGATAMRPAMVTEIASYRRALHQKRALLRREADRPSLEAWNAVLARAAAALIVRRSRYVERLQEKIAALEREGVAALSGLRLRYRPDPPVADAAAIEAQLDQALAEERRRRRPLSGPHRDRLEIEWRQREIARSASAGERKAIGITLATALAHLLRDEGREPCVLVDDADAELDRATLERVFRPLQEVPQLLASSNRPEVWGTIPHGCEIRLHDGSVKTIK